MLDLRPGLYLNAAHTSTRMTVAFLEPNRWRSVFLGLSAFPVLAASTVLRLVGQRLPADRLSSWIDRAWLGRETDGTPRPGTWRRLAALGISLVAFIVTAYLLIGIVINLAYPLRPDSKPTDWGGPSLGGRWMAHGAGGVLFAIVTPVLCERLRRLATRVFSWKDR